MQGMSWGPASISVSAMSIDFSRGARIDLFKGLDDELVADLLRQAQSRIVAADSRIYDSGSPARDVHALVSGCVKLVQVTPTGERVILRYVEPGEAFGTPALLDGHYRADAVTVTQCVVLQWPSSLVRALISSQPSAALNALRHFEMRLECLEGRLRNLYRGRIEQRIAHVLLDLVDRFGRQAGEGIEISFPISRQDIADLSGTTLPTASRMLGHWEQQGYIKRGWRRIVVSDPAGLRMLLRQRPSIKSSPKLDAQAARRRST
jgi:CRP-like cAMP-binding protein